MKQLLKNADILVRNADWDVIRNGYLGIDGNKICYVGSEKPAEDYDVVRDFSRHLLMPGLYNMHTHAGMSLLRGLGSGLPLDRWLFDKILPIERQMTDQDFRVGTMISVMELLASGVVNSCNMYFKPDVYVEELIASGMRMCMTSAMMSVAEQDTAGLQLQIDLAKNFFDDYNNAGDGRIKVHFAIHAEYTTLPKQVVLYSEACRSKNSMLQVHVSESEKEHEGCKQRYQKTPTQYFHDLGVFENPTIAAHCIWAEPADIQLLKLDDVTVVHNPSSNMKLGSGFMPMREMMDAGVRVTLGTDGSASNNNQNMFEELHLAALINSGYTLDPTVLQPSQLLDMVTINGALSLGLLDCGQIAVGNKADIIAIDMDKPHLIPDHDTPSLLVYSAQAADVDMTMVDGVVLYEKGEYKTIDAEKMKAELAGCVRRIFG